MKINVKKLNENAKLPMYATKSSAGGDLYAFLDSDVTIKQGETKIIKTGLAFAIPEGYMGLVYARSGLSIKEGLAPANKVGVIDADYRGELMVALYNQSSSDKIVKNGDRIAQFIIAPYIKADYEIVEDLDETTRGAGGFGSTGTN